MRSYKYRMFSDLCIFTSNTFNLSIVTIMNLKGKIVIVSGAGSGIGAKTAEFFCRANATTVLVDVNETKLKKVSDTCKKFAVEFISIKADVSNDEDVKGIVDTTLKKFGKIDVLVNNAAVAFYGSILDGTFMESYDGMVNINLRAILQLTCLAAPHLIKTKGNIVNISSVASLQPSKIIGAYGILKAAVNHFTRIAAFELGSSGVRVNAISPGPTYTDLIKNSEAPFTFEDLKSDTLLNRISEPDEVADLVLYLASDKARGVTGSNYVIDNGTLLMQKDH